MTENNELSKELREENERLQPRIKDMERDKEMLPIQTFTSQISTNKG